MPTPFLLALSVLVAPHPVPEAPCASMCAQQCAYTKLSDCDGVCAHRCPPGVPHNGAVPFEVLAPDYCGSPCGGGYGTDGCRGLCTVCERANPLAVGKCVAHKPTPVTILAATVSPLVSIYKVGYPEKAECGQVCGTATPLLHTRDPHSRHHPPPTPTPTPTPPRGPHPTARAPHMLTCRVTCPALSSRRTT